MRVLLLLIFCFFSLQLTAQLGLSMSYNHQWTNGWNREVNEEYQHIGKKINLLPSGYEIGFDYTRKFAHYKTKLVLSGSFTQFQQTMDSPVADVDYAPQTFSQQMLGLHVKLSFYPLHKINDHFFNQRWHWQLIAGGKSTQNTFEINVDGNVANRSARYIVPNVGLGTGIDLSIHKYYTLTPFVNCLFGLSDKWDNLHRLHPFVNSAGGISLGGNSIDDPNGTITIRLLIGVRIGFNLHDLMEIQG